MKVKNQWVLLSQTKILNRKLENIFDQFVGQQYDPSVKKIVYALIKEFVDKEKLPDDTAFFIKLEKQLIGSSIVQIFKGVQIVN